MGRAGGLVLGRIVRIGALGVVCAALAACSAADKFGAKNSKFSKRIVEDGEPIPKGNGSYKVGQPYRLNGKTYYPVEDPSYRAEGVASWYGPDFHGRETANGEVYDMHGISAAHTTLPIPSYARVTNLENGRSIIVRVNDRGPYVGNRIIDLSIGTAKALDTYSKGLSRVRVEYVGRAPLEGSDDQMLLATLRQGSPVPSLVMVASAKPFVPSLGQDRENAAARGRDGAPIPVERPYALGTASSSRSAQAAAVDSGPAGTGSAGKPRSVARLPDQSTAPSQGRTATPTAGFAPAPAEGVGLMSGRGLY
jgi:rare lipoprotein A